MSAYEHLVEETPTSFRLRTQIYTDPRIFADEMRRIFETTWVYLAHESEVQRPGDYRTTYLGQQPVIVSRTADDAVHVLFNACRHRGNVVCRADRGTASFFRCSYHGWVYGNDGALTGAAERSGYADDFPQDQLGLVRAPRVARYRGLVFASLSPQGEPLEDYLGEVKDYVDLWADRSPTGTVRVRRPHQFQYPGNWKLQAENGADGYHGRYVHESAFKTLEHFQGGEGRREKKMSVHGVGAMRGFPFGHAILERPGNRGELPPEMLAEHEVTMVRRYGAERAERIGMVRHIFVFPNVYLMDDNIRVIHPIAVDRTEVHSAFTLLDGVPDAINKARLKNLQWRLGTAGLIGTDDLEMFAGCQTAMQASAMGQTVLGRGLHREIAYPTGERVGESSDETPQRAIYREWARLMAAPDGRGNGA
jgi:phenylpropionate dioxygenase-like ring-hydroxylating dioxygenase large terminal subunit